MRFRPGYLALGLALAGAAAPVAFATPAEDFQTVFNDWRGDSDVTSCRFSRDQLANARRIADGIRDFDAYAPGFRDEASREIRRWDSGGCTGTRAVAAVKVAGVKPRGKKGESVRLKNTGGATAVLRGSTLRDRSGKRLRFPRSTKIRAGRSLTVITGCPRGRRRGSVLRRGRVYGCRSEMWNDRGDIVKLVDSMGRVASQRGFRKYRRARRF